jgi:hypothetical protein
VAVGVAVAVSPGVPGSSAGGVSAGEQPGGQDTAGSVGVGGSVEVAGAAEVAVAAAVPPSAGVGAGSQVGGGGVSVVGGGVSVVGGGVSVAGGGGGVSVAGVEGGVSLAAVEGTEDWLDGVAGVVADASGATAGVSGAVGVGAAASGAADSGAADSGAAGPGSTGAEGSGGRGASGSSGAGESTTDPSESTTEEANGDGEVAGSESSGSPGPVVYQASNPGATTPMAGICRGPGRRSKSSAGGGADLVAAAGDVPPAAGTGPTVVWAMASREAMVSAVAPAPSTDMAEAERSSARCVPIETVFLPERVRPIVTAIRKPGPPTRRRPLQVLRPLMAEPGAHSPIPGEVVTWREQTVGR